MSRRSRIYFFENTFADGERPDENDFMDVWDSFINFEDDPITIDLDNNFVFSQGIRIGNSPSNTLGTIRFNGNSFEFREASGWQPLGAGGGVFQPVEDTNNVAYNDGRVGIGTGATSTNYQFEARIGINNGPTNQIRLGSAVIHDRGTGATPDRAYFSHFSRANDEDFALRQREDGDVNLNAPASEPIRFSQDGSQIRMAILADSGDVVIGGGSVNNAVSNANPDAHLFVSGDLVIFTGNTFISLRELEARVSELEP